MGYLQPRQSDFTLIRSKARPVPPLAHRLRISATNGTRIVGESGRLDEYQRDGFATYPVPSIMLTALVLVPSGAHLAALSNPDGNGTGSRPADVLSLG